MRRYFNVLHFYALVCALEDVENAWKNYPGSASFLIKPRGITSSFPTSQHKNSPSSSFNGFPFTFCISFRYFIFASRHCTLPVLPECEPSFPHHEPPAGCALLTPLCIMLLRNLLSWFFLNADTFTWKICCGSWALATLFHWIVSIKKLSSKLRKKKIKCILQKDNLGGFVCENRAWYTV